MGSPRVLFAGCLYAGHRTRFLNLRANTEHDPRIEATYRIVTGWREGGLVERLGVLPASVRGRARALVDGACLASLPRPDVIWTSAGDELLAPYAWAQLGPLRRPIVMDMDATPALLERDAETWYRRPPKRGVGRRMLDLRLRVAYGTVGMFVAWSRWAAEGIEREGVEPERIRILPPGVDLAAWSFTARRPPVKPRLLFVGADFERKGGLVLLEVLRSRLRDRVELDVVTLSDVEPEPGVRVHRAGPNSPELRRLFAEADLFVLPSRAECFGIAAIEAMASGLPVVMGEAGAAREIVEQGETGWVVRPEPEELACVLEAALAQPERLPSMGRRAREAAEQRFDGRRNDGRLVDLLLEVHSAWR
jgi:glycosyltransferase involved in cell wall biosynthesis